jgi:hypothetical protein
MSLVGGVSFTLSPAEEDALCGDASVLLAAVCAVFGVLGAVAGDVAVAVAGFAKKAIRLFCFMFFDMAEGARYLHLFAMHSASIVQPCS